MPPSHTKKVNTAITVPRELYESVVAFLQADKNHGYVSAAEFFKDAARRRLEELGFSRRAADLGKRLDDLTPDVDRASTKLRAGAPSSAGFCHKCGKPLPLGAVFCPACGTRSG